MSLPTAHESHDDQILDDQIIEPVGYDFGLTRRNFVQILGAGLLIVAGSSTLAAQEQRRGGSGAARGGGGGSGGRRDSRPVPLEARLHIAKDGAITVMTGKVEGGQGARAEITQAAAEELRVSPARITLIMADTALTPDDGITAGSRTTPSTLPAIRAACATARRLLLAAAARTWNASADTITVNDGTATLGDKRMTYADLAADASSGAAGEAFKQTADSDAAITPSAQWKSLGTPLPRPNARDLVTGAHHYPSDVIRPGMLYGKILRRPSFGAKLTEIDLAPASAIDGVTVVRDGGFVGVAAANTHLAKRAIAALETTATWDEPPHPSSKTLSAYLSEHAKDDTSKNPFADDIASAAKSLKASYRVAYAQHAPMEPRAAVAEWDDGKLTVWTATQNPFGVRRELAGAFHIDESSVRVIVPDFGGGFGGKHTGETAIEAARLAQAAKKPVAVRWTRAEEFTWAYFRPAAVINVEAGLGADGKLTSWHFININSGPSALETPYRVAKNQCRFVQSDPPLRHGSYRALAATANTFARESFMDELATAAGVDPLEFRRQHLDDDRLRAVLDESAKHFGWSDRRDKKAENAGIGLACGTDKGSFVAACAEVEVDRAHGVIRVVHICQAYECGAIINPANLMSQVQGAIIMGLGPALRESVDFEDGRILGASFWKYEVPRLKDVPRLEVHLVNRPDLPSAGAGECPLIAVAPAIANAVFHATGIRLREMPLRLPV